MILLERITKQVQIDLSGLRNGTFPFSMMTATSVMTLVVFVVVIAAVVWRR
jgi:hypothetical protein